MLGPKLGFYFGRPSGVAVELAGVISYDLNSEFRAILFSAILVSTTFDDLLGDEFVLESEQIFELQSC